METQAELHLLHHAYLEPAVPSLLGTVSYVRRRTQSYPHCSCSLPEKTSCTCETVTREFCAGERERQRQPSLSRRNYCWSWMVPLWQAACGCTAERIPCRRGQGLAGVPAAWLGWGDGGAGGGCRASCWAAVSGRSSHPAGFPCLSTQLVQSSVDLLTHWCIFLIYVDLFLPESGGNTNYWFI